MTRRVLLVGALALVVAAAGAYALLPERGMPEGAPTQDEMARSIGSEIMEHIYLGHVPDRSGEIMLVPKPHRYLIGAWDLTTLGTNTPVITTSHPNPWDYVMRVPIIVYRPGVVASGTSDYSEVDIADLAPTYANVLGMDDFVADGEPLPGLDFEGTEMPKVIFTVVLDGGGWNALQQHPNAWPEISRLRAGGTTYLNATIGSAPAITGAMHATLGTGSYPIKHGLPGNQMRGPDGRNTDVFKYEADPSYLLLPAVSELWDETNNNDAVVATVSYNSKHLGMIGHGAQREGGDRDVAVLWEPDEDVWWVNEEFYELPDYLAVTDIPKLEAYERSLFLRDGVADDLWFGHDLEVLQDGAVRPGTPAFVRFTGDAVIDVMRNEGVGRDSITDLMWVEMKMPDFAGHAWNMVGSEQGDVIREVDRQIGRFVDELDRTVGTGNYLLAITADHGQQPVAEQNGGWRIYSRELQRDIEGRFGPVVEKITTVDIFLDRTEVERRGIDPEDIARYIGTYTIAENIPGGAPGADRVPRPRLNERLFAGAFTSDYLVSLTPGEITSFGAGDYPEGRLYITEPAGAP